MGDLIGDGLKNHCGVHIHPKVVQVDFRRLEVAVAQDFLRPAVFTVGCPRNNQDLLLGSKKQAGIEWSLGLEPGYLHNLAEADSLLEIKQ